MVAEAIFGEIELDHIEDEMRREWTRAVTRWYQLNYALIHEVTSEYDFPACLSEDQYHSFRILREWWRAEYQPAEYSLSEVRNIVNHCDEVVLADVWDSVLGSLMPLKWPTKAIRCCETDEHPFYSWSMRHLFQLEFVWDTEDFRICRRNELRNYRYHGKLRAYCQQLKMAVFEKEAGILDQELRTQDEDRLLEPLDLEHGPPISPCPWLPKITGELKEDMPFYLWDRDESKTIETAELDDVVDYTAVSHKWGRWVKNGQWAQVAGVPWPVPQNQQFDVHGLVNRLRSLDCGTRYLWFDLFCIPQDRSTRSKIEIARQEIARQATIFRAARRAVAWLKDVHDFEGLQAVLLYMLYSMVSMPTGSKECTIASRLAEDALKAVAYKSTGLLEPWEVPLRPWELRPNVWFTSLWTLQELCLRPDMWLCSSDFKTLSVFGDQPLSVLGILTIWRFHEEERRALVKTMPQNALPYNPFDSDSLDERGHHQIHLAFTEFFWWIFHTNLNKLPDITRVDIISMGDKRACTRRRGEAIMSAVGVTAWFDSFAQQAGTEDLVLDKYPRSFVEEFKNAEPGDFFGHLVKFEDTASGAQAVDSSVALRPENRPHHERPVEYYYIRESPRGSMLPFSQHEAIYLDVLPFRNIDLVAHESVRSWRIQLDGSVHISEACVLASSSPDSRPSREDRKICPVLLTGFGSNKVPHSDGSISDEHSTTHARVDLGDWIRSRDFEAHAVLITQCVYTNNMGRSQGNKKTSVFFPLMNVAELSTMGSLVSLPYELKEHIFTYLFQQLEGPIVIKGHEILFRHHSDLDRPLVGERPRAYLLPHENEGHYSLYSKHPLGQVNRRLRRDVSTFLRTTSVDVVTRAEGFDYSHVTTFLESLPATKREAFHVQPGVEADLTRTLRIELQPPFDSWSSNLPVWFSSVTSLLPPGEELSTAYTLAPYPRHHRHNSDMLFSLYGHWKSMSGSPAREEFRKILSLFWGRLMEEWMRVYGAPPGAE
ncbi:hypothetical protein PRZ48_012797 [Zasmidium cellare]|uniref:Heterokaryon incompatibility domain-containing protein n=1 Tax=Zasmidium cellare TaxID=395010 RepID=A0ABR0E6V8_ZASCE|nr:hypothetical protein PRZ48_012797 [Zasmidium cellare]